MVLKSSTALFFSRMFRAWGPTMTPEMMRPMTPGTLNCRRINGASRMMKSTTQNTSTGFCKGNANSRAKCSKNPLSFMVPPTSRYKDAGYGHTTHPAQSSSSSPLTATCGTPLKIQNFWPTKLNTAQMPVAPTKATRYLRGTQLQVPY
jgi:hypothetical protein